MLTQACWHPPFLTAHSFTSVPKYGFSSLLDDSVSGERNQNLVHFQVNCSVHGNYRSLTSNLTVIPPEGWWQKVHGSRSANWTSYLCRIGHQYPEQSHVCKNTCHTKYVQACRCDHSHHCWICSLLKRRYLLKRFASCAKDAILLCCVRLLCTVMKDKNWWGKRQIPFWILFFVVFMSLPTNCVFFCSVSWGFCFLSFSTFSSTPRELSGAIFPVGVLYPARRNQARRKHQRNSQIQHQRRVMLSCSLSLHQQFQFVYLFLREGLRPSVDSFPLALFALLSTFQTAQTETTPKCVINKNTKHNLPCGKHGARKQASVEFGQQYLLGPVSSVIMWFFLVFVVWFFWRLQGWNRNSAQKTKGKNGHFCFHRNHKGPSERSHSFSRFKPEASLCTHISLSCSHGFYVCAVSLVQVQQCSPMVEDDSVLSLLNMSPLSLIVSSQLFIKSSAKLVQIPSHLVPSLVLIWRALGCNWRPDFPDWCWRCHVALPSHCWSAGTGTAGLTLGRWSLDVFTLLRFWRRKYLKMCENTEGWKKCLFRS